MLTVVQRGGATTQKPPEIVRGMASRLPWVWDSLCFAIPLNDATRDSARDLVYNVAPSSFIGSPVWTRDDKGNAALYLDTASYVEYPDTAAHNRASTAVTAYVRFRRAGTAEAAGGLLCKRYGPPTDWPEFSWAIQHTDAGNNVLAGAVGVNGGAVYWEAPGYVMGTTEWVSAFVRWQSPEQPTLTVFGDRGQILTSATYTDNPFVSGTITYKTGEPIRMNALHDTLQFNADYSQALVWSRKLSTVEMQAIVVDPYGWYSPRRETVGLSSSYPLVAGGGELRFGTGSGGLR